MLGGTVRSAAIAEDARRLALQYVSGNATKVLNNIRVDAPTQVQLRVKIAEVERGSLKRIGVNWQNIANLALFGVGPGRVGAATNTIQAVGGPPSALIAGTSNDGSLTGLIDLLATQSQANILAEPNSLRCPARPRVSWGGLGLALAPQGGSIISVAKQAGVSCHADHHRRSNQPRRPSQPR